ncbi:PREDICTED: uncharacterized protein LOC105960733 [Erythranthe guttata]|uniref:uncharacterized protein LOC105960733 n=1 Tax=Erythranthe guttata TaxID=4155 RepID=UPI00064DC6D7|nr:PREDICTED: uncharacterized protein LOC105960733 [Erythranthe guttata]|eukprot:XP_012840394.1 PREDICTED: uncharacterized protein LOC105960733 [Erythranthe guttata]
MEETETISQYNEKLIDLANEFQSLGGPLSNETLVNKVLRTLLERFSMTVTAIEEAKDTSSLRLDDLIAESSKEAVRNEEEMCKKLFSDLEKKTHALDAANKENSSLKDTITHLEVGITKKDLELAKVPGQWIIVTKQVIPSHARAQE